MTARRCEIRGQLIVPLYEQAGAIREVPFSLRPRKGLVLLEEVWQVNDLLLLHAADKNAITLLIICRRFLDANAPQLLYQQSSKFFFSQWSAEEIKESHRVCLAGFVGGKVGDKRLDDYGSRLSQRRASGARLCVPGS
jgi:hypothetical protein